MGIIIPKIGNWITVIGFDNVGKIYCIDEENKNFGADFLAEEDVIYFERWSSIPLDNIESVIEDPKEIEFFEKELEKII